VAFPLAAVRPRAVAAALCGLAGIALEAVAPSATAVLMAIVALMQASRFEAPVGPGLAVIVTVGYEAAAVAALGSFNLAGLLASASGLVFAYLAASSFRRLRVEKGKTEALLREVLAGRDAQIRAATLDERARIAREIHDILAHTLSALAVQLEGTRLLVEQRPDDPAALAALERASSLARDGLEETRRAVGALRGDALPGAGELPRLAADFERDTGTPCTLTVEGTPVALSPEAHLSLYRTAQEALTNVRKHAAASLVTIRLRYDRGGAELTGEAEGTPRPLTERGSPEGTPSLSVCWSPTTRPLSARGSNCCWASAPASRSWAAPPTATRPCAWWASCAPMWCSWTCACRAATAWTPRDASPVTTRRRAWSC
jgi:signal transduction histidine kinase